MADCGINAGHPVGQADELEYNVVEDSIDVHNLHAKILCRMCLDHTMLTYWFQGRAFHLTDCLRKRRKEIAGLARCLGPAAAPSLGNFARHVWGNLRPRTVVLHQGEVETASIEAGCIKLSTSVSPPGRERN
jgi:hypothetical protein